MKELLPDEYNIVSSLMKGIEFDTVFASAVIEGRQGGRVWVDRTDNPSSAFILHYFGMALLCGNTENTEFAKEIVNILFKKSNIRHLNFRLVVHPKEWERTFEKVLGNKLIYYPNNEEVNSFNLNEISRDHVIGFTRVKMKFNEEEYNGKAKPKRIPEGFDLKKIDETLFKRISGTIVPVSFWDTFENFNNEGIGYCLLQNGKIVSTSFSAYISSNMIDIGVETSQEYRGQGLAVYPCISMVEYCLGNGFEPIWGCRKDNVQSFRLAKKLGFEEKAFHPVYWPLSSDS